MLLMLILGAYTSLGAQVNITLGEGTGTNSTTGAPTPYGTYFKNFRQQYLVLASELNDIGGGVGNINSIAFNVGNLNNCSPMPNYRIRVKATNQTVLTTTFEPGTYTQVFQANEFMPVAGWNTHTFSTPVYWDGASNLLVDIVTDLFTNTYTQNASVYYTPTALNSSLRNQSDSAGAADALTGTATVNRANIRFNMAALDITDLNALSITGPATPNVNSTVNYSVSIKNYSNVALSNYTVKLMKTGGIELASLPGTAINPQQTLAFTLPWTPTVVGETQLYGKVILVGDENPANDETSRLTVNVMAAGLLVAEIGNGTTTNTNTGAPAPYGTWYRGFRQQLLYKAVDFQGAGAAAGLISALAFNVLDLDTCSPMVNYTIRLKTTTQDALSTTFETGTYTTVWQSNDFMPTTGWNMHAFMVPFLWDGTTNLLVDISTDTMVGTLGRNALVPYTTTTYNSSLRFQSDSVNGSTGLTGTTTLNRSNIRFFMSPPNPNPQFAVSPPSKNFGDVLLGFAPSQSFSVMNAGGGTLSISSISISGSPFFSLIGLPTLPAQLVLGTPASFNVVYAPTAGGDHTATVTITDNRRMTHTIALSGHGVDTTIYELSHTENFDAVTIPALPLGWSSIYQATSTTGYVKTVTTSPQSAPNCVSIYNPTDINTIAMLIAPPLATTIPTSSVRVKLWGKGTGYSLKVGVMSNPADASTFTEIGTLTFTNAWAQYQVSLGSYTGTGKFIAFKHANNSAGQTIYVDNVELEMMGANDLAGVSISGNSTPSVNNATQYTVNVFNNGTAPQSNYSVKLYNSSNVELATTAGTAIAPGASVDLVVNWTPSTQGPMSIYGKVVLAGDINPGNDATAPMSISVQPAGVITVTIGDGSQTARMPLDFFYKSSIYQNIYYPAEIGTVGNISTISLYNQFFTTTLVNKPIKIWMGITAQPDLNAGWIPSTSMTLVYDGTMNFPGGANTITFPLQIPFAYTGGNLVVMFLRPLDTAYYSSSDYFKTQTGVTGRAREMHSDSTVYDPANLTSGTLTGIFPKTTLTMTPMTGDPVFMMNPVSHNFGEVNIGGSRSQNFTIVNAGGGNLGINTISIAGSPNLTLSNLPTLPASLSTGQTAVFTVNYTPTSQGVAAATVTVTDNRGRSHVLGGKSDRLMSVNREAHTVQITGVGVTDITVGSGNQTARVPIDFYYKNSLFETIYTIDELNNFAGMITGLKFYNQFTSNLTDKPMKIWLGSTAQTDLSTDWIPSTQMTQVFDGTVDFPSGGNVISITFPEPFLHVDGGNLVMMVNRPLAGEYHSSGDNFQCQTIGTNRSRKLQSDSIEYNPAAPAAGTLSGQFPKTTFMVIPGNIGHITGVVTGAGNAPLADVQVNVNSRPYATATNAQGQFIINNVLPGDYVVSFSRHGYVDRSINIVLDEDETEVMNVTMTLMAQVNVTGTILASDTSSGIAGANITLVGYENYSGSSIGNGSFTIPSVFANQSYAYSISAVGYTSVNGTIDVAAANHSMGSITLSEIAYAPNTVRAVVAPAFNAVNLSWNAPNPNAIEITESFEAATFPPTGWTQSITNAGPANPLGVKPTWCSFGTINITGSGNVMPTEGSKQAGLWWDYEHQDESLYTPSFNCPPDAHLSFDTYGTLGSPNGDHYYVKISSNGGNTWTVLWDASSGAAGVNHYAYPISVDLSAYAGMEVKLAFHAIDPPANTGLWFPWFIDNLYIGNFVDNVRFAGAELADTRSIAHSSNAGSGNTPSRLARAESFYNSSVTPGSLSRSIRSTDRVLTGYKVWRLTVGQENNESTWVSITPEMVTTLSYESPAWNTLPNGNYKWAVRAVYTANVMSAPAFSNALLKEVVSGNIVGFVRKQINNQGIAGATVTVPGGFTATTNSSGAFSLNVPAGMYNVSASATGFATLTQENISVAPNQNTTVNFLMSPVSNEDEQVPITVTALGGNYPNPFNPETTISYDIKDAASVRLDVYNLKGQLVRNLVNADQAAGRYRVIFNARDDKGNTLSSGIYLYRFSAGTYSSTRKMMLME